MNWIRTLVVLVCLTLVGGCSNAFVYNQLDWLIPWYLDDYVDLSRAQKKDLKTRLQPLLRWHRTEELASYLEILDRVEHDLQQPVTGATVRDWVDAVWSAYKRLEQRMLPVAFQLGEQLSDAQMATFIERLQRKQVELEEEYLGRTDQEYIEDNFKNFESILGEFLGRLESAQEELLRDAAQSLIRFDEAWLEERRAWLDKLKQLLQREPGWQQALRDALAAREENRNREYREAYTYNREIIFNATADVLMLRTDQQSERLQREINTIRADLRKLISQAN